MDNKKVDIGIHISSDLDPKGFKEANDHMDKASKKGGQAGKGVQNSMKGAQNAAAQAGEAASAMFSNMGAAGAAAAAKIRTAFAAISSALGGFGLLAAISAFITLASKVKDAWQALNDRVYDAGERIRKDWEMTQDTMEKAAAREASLEWLKSQRDYHAQILGYMKSEAEFQAAMREIEARRNGDNLAADKAAIEGAFARGEITKAEYTKKVRELEDKAREQKQKNEMAGLTAEEKAALEGKRAAYKENQDATKELNSFVDMLGNLSQDEKDKTPEGFEKSVKKQGAKLAEALGAKKQAEDTLVMWQSDEDEARNEEAIQSSKAYLDQVAGMLNVATRYKNTDGKWVDKEPKQLADDILEAMKTKREKLGDEANASQARANEAGRKADQATAKKEATQKAQEAENTRVAKQREQEDETNAYVAGKQVKKLTKETETADQQRDRQRQREQLRDAKTKADIEKTKADETVEESVELVRGWWETNREALEKEAKKNETGPQAGLYKQAEKLFQGMNGNADPSKVAMLASFLEHSDFGDANLRRGVNGLMEAQGRREQAKGDVDTVAAADKAAREVDTAMQEQGQQQTLVDQFTASLKEIIDNKTATKGNDETYKQLAELARQAFADGQLTADESGRLTEALGRLSDASGEQGQAFINLVQKAVAGINAAAARSDELKGRIASLEKQINEAQRKLAKKE